jgi:hypothetical protein
MFFGSPDRRRFSTTSSMKTITLKIPDAPMLRGTLVTGVLALACGAGYLVGQGSLTPPGAPAPIFKTLDQTEPRTPLSTAGTPGDADSVFRISVSGSYYLTGNLIAVAGKHGIEIAASGVTIDLMGFSLQGVAGSLDGIHLGGSDDIHIHNGHVIGWAGAGLKSDVGSFNAMIEDIVFHNNAGGGIAVDDRALIRRCIVSGGTGVGIQTGDNAHISECTIQGAAGGGIVAGQNGIVRNCILQQNGLISIQTNAGNLIENNNIRTNNSVATGETAIELLGSNSLVRGNVMNFGDIGVDAASIDNVIVSNKISTTIIEQGSSSNVVGETLTAATVNTTDNPWGNIEP